MLATAALEQSIDAPFALTQKLSHGLVDRVGFKFRGITTEDAEYRPQNDHFEDTAYEIRLGIFREILHSRVIS